MAHQVFDRVTRGAGDPPSAPGGGHRLRLHRDVVGAFALVVVAAAVVVRLAFLHNQSYWVDESFSVTQASGSLQHAFDVGQDEIHTPLYAVLLWVWEQLGGSGTAWTRALSALFGLGAVAASYTGLRTAGVSNRARWLAVALTAGNGFGIVYGQESRPYALALLGATGLTAATVRQVATLRGTVPEPMDRWRRPAAWLAWAVLTSTAHLLGAALVGVLALTLAVTAWRRRRAMEGGLALGLGAVALVPQLAWILIGIGRRGFAAGTTWIPAPRPHDVWILLTTVFSAGGLRPRSDGFSWTSPAGVAVVVVLLLVAGALALPGLRRARGDERTADTDGRTADLRMGLVLLVAAAVTLVGIYLLAGQVHIWTLRNMIVVVPALTWGLAWVVTALPTRERARQGLAVAVLVATLASLGVVADDLRRPYKTDWRGLVLYLAHERAARPSATFSLFGGFPLDELVAADLGTPPDPVLRRIESRVDAHPRSLEAISGLRRLPGPQTVVYYNGIADPNATEAWVAIRKALADPSCQRVPIYGLVVVSCP